VGSESRSLMGRGTAKQAADERTAYQKPHEPFPALQDP
jgi:hypothetical protein